MAHEAASYLIRPGSGEVFELTWEALIDLDTSLSDPNPATTLPPPNDITPPMAQYSELLLVYGDQVVLVPFSIAYTVNPDVASVIGMPTTETEITATPAGEGHTSAGMQIVLVAVGAGLAALIAWLVVRWGKRQ